VSKLKLSYFTKKETKQNQPIADIYLSLPVFSKS